MLAEVSTEHIATDAQYLTSYHGEIWTDGFNLPFLRMSGVACGVSWPFPSMAYADMPEVVDWSETDETYDLVGVYTYY